MSEELVHIVSRPIAVCLVNRLNRVNRCHDILVVAAPLLKRKQCHCVGVEDFASQNNLSQRDTQPVFPQLAFDLELLGTERAGYHNRQGTSCPGSERYSRRTRKPCMKQTDCFFKKNRVSRDRKSTRLNSSH